MENKPVTFQFISEPTDVNFGGNVHGGSVMKWIDQVGYACASNWSEVIALRFMLVESVFINPLKLGKS